MIINRETPTSNVDSPALDGPPFGWPLLRWFASSATSAMPQAAGPVAFSLLSLSLLGDASGGAAIILAMTLAQVVGAVPITRLGKNLPSVTYLRLLVVFRTLALVAVTLFAHYQAPFAWLVVCAAVAGSVSGAAYGYLRSLLNQFTSAARLPRALGIAATIHEATFVLGPVVASALGSVSPVFAILTVTIIGAAPALLIPQAGKYLVEDVPPAKVSILNPAISLWLTCAAILASAVAAVEIGAVALALKFGYAPALAILFTVPLCLASVAGGIWVSVRNRISSQKAVLIQLSIVTTGSALIALGPSLATTIAGTLLIGSVLAPLGTYFSLILDALAPPQKRPEVFALLRTAYSVGIILASAMLTAFSLSSALIVVTGMMIGITLIVGFAPAVRQP